MYVDLLKTVANKNVIQLKRHLEIETKLHQNKIKKVKSWQQHK